MGKKLTSRQITSFRRSIYTYFDKHGRQLPFRDIADTYAIYVSEVMLQQTQVNRVCEKFVSFIKRFRSWKALANARLSDVLAEWQGLGYNRRAKSLHEAAKVIVQSFGGETPARPEDLITLPGIGPATAASIAAFAFNQPVVFIETNIRSVFIHHFFSDRDDVSDDELQPLVEQTLDVDSPARWYSALMDYGVYLKARHANPSRKSRHHSSQSKFEGSRRQVRGRILKHLLAGKLTLKGLEKAVNDTEGRTSSVAEEMMSEKLIQKKGRYFSVP